MVRSDRSVDIGRIWRIDNLAIGVILFNHENDVIGLGRGEALSPYANATESMVTPTAKGTAIVLTMSFHSILNV